jgi:hypothetical protein
MHRIVVIGCTIALSLVLAAAGCVPNRGAVSPDGRTFYFSLNPEGGFEIQENSNLYALDIETGRLKALTDGPMPKFWCSLSSDGHMLAYQSGAGSGFSETTLHLLELEQGITWPLTGILDKHAYPWIIPGNQPMLLAMNRPSELEPPSWSLYDPNPIALALPPESAAALGNVGLADSRCAFTVHRGLPPAKGEPPESAKMETAVYVADLIAVQPPPADAPKTEAPKPEAPKAEGAKVEILKAEGPAVQPAGEGVPVPPAAAGTPKINLVRVAAWDDLKVREPIVDLAFTADGKRLVAALGGCGEAEDSTRFVELDPTGKLPPKFLFDAPKAYAPQWTPDGKGLAYLRIAADNEKFRELVIWRPEAKEPVVLARLSGGFASASAVLYWMADGRLRIYDISEEGVRLVETTLDGKTAKGRLLTRDRLKAARRLADLQRLLDRVGPPANMADQPWPEAYAAPMKQATAAVESVGTSTKAAMEAAWNAVAKWEEVPAMAPMPAPVSSPAKEGAAPAK